MLPPYFTIQNFLSVRNAPILSLTEVSDTPGMYMIWLNKEQFDLIKQDVLGQIFMHGGACYKITECTLGQQSETNSLYAFLFKIDPYTDDLIDKLDTATKRVKEALSVCADSIEDLGFFRAANYVNKHVPRLVTNLIIEDIRDRLNVP